MILITGVPGWLGIRFVRVFQEGISGMVDLTAKYSGEKVRCLVEKGIDVALLRCISKDIEIIEGDVTDPESLKFFFQRAEGSVLFHMAGLIHPKRIKDLYKVNTEGTRNIINEAIKGNVKRIVMMSSNSAIGCNPSKNQLFDEKSPYNHYMNYGMSKKLAEDIANEANASGKIETTIVRGAWFYGPDQPPRQTLFFNMIREGKAPIVGDGENLRSMSYVDNTCQGLLLAGKSDNAKGQTYWIADRRPYTMNEIVDTVERLLEKEFNMTVVHKRMRLPGFVSEVALACDKILQAAGMYNQKIHVLSEMNKNIACSVEKAVKELGYDPKIGLEEGMRRSIRWCLDNGMKI